MSKFMAELSGVKVEEPDIFDRIEEALKLIITLAYLILGLLTVELVCILIVFFWR